MNRHVWRWPLRASLVGTAAFLPWASIFVPVFSALPFFALSAMYWPVPLLILVYAILLRRRAPETAVGMLWGATILALSLVFRSLDGPLCTAIPAGTHFLWHLLNALMLAWMIEVYRRHLLEGGRRGR